MIPSVRRGFFTITPNLAINGFLGYTNSRIFKDAEMLTFGTMSLGFAFPDVGKDGNLGGLVVGVQPYQANNPTDANDLPIHVEAFYKYQINDNIAITPGLFLADQPWLK
ncbi:MAG UNVERIFIED_CONTAM: carbohydrate porin [Microcystis novacekii LVE1205-3]